MILVSLGHVDVDFVIGGHVQDPSTGQRGPLEHKSSDEHVQSNAAEPIALQEGHQKTKTNEHHHVDVLEDCKHKETKNYPIVIIIVNASDDKEITLL